MDGYTAKFLWGVREYEEDHNGEGEHGRTAKRGRTDEPTASGLEVDEPTNRSTDQRIEMLAGHCRAHTTTTTTAKCTGWVGRGGGMEQWLQHTPTTTHVMLAIVVPTQHVTLTGK